MHRGHPLAIQEYDAFGCLSIYPTWLDLAPVVFRYRFVDRDADRSAESTISAKAAIEAQQIGQYKLEQKIDSGGMGVVYKAHHTMLRRPTAIKMLDIDKVNEASIGRFEREVDHEPAQ